MLSWEKGKWDLKMFNNMCYTMCSTTLWVQHCHLSTVRAHWEEKRYSSISVFIKKNDLFRGVLHKNDELGLWGVPLPTDEPVVYRTQRYRYEVLGQRPLQFQQFLGVRSSFQGVGLLLGMAYFTFLCFFSWTRKLLLKVITIH